MSAQTKTRIEIGVSGLLLAFLFFFVIYDLRHPSDLNDRLLWLAIIVIVGPIAYRWKRRKLNSS